MVDVEVSQVVGGTRAFHELVERVDVVHVMHGT